MKDIIIDIWENKGAGGWFAEIETKSNIYGPFKSERMLKKVLTEAIVNCNIVWITKFWCGQSLAYVRMELIEF